MATKRDYKHEYEKFQSSTEQKQNRAKRNKARREAERDGKVKKGDNKHLHHFKGIEIGKVKVVDAKENLSKNEKSRKKGSKRDTKNWGK